jgi:hypothetical protein
MTSFDINGRAVSVDAEEDTLANWRLVILSDGLWRRRFNADPGVIGQTLVLSGRPYTVVGVMPTSFRFPDGHTELWIPAAFEPEQRVSRTEYMLDVVGRLKPGATIESARAQLDTVMARLRVDHPQANETVGGSVFPLKGEYVTSVQTRLLVLMAAVGAGQQWVEVEVVEVARAAAHLPQKVGAADDLEQGAVAQLG